MVEAEEAEQHQFMKATAALLASAAEQARNARAEQASRPPAPPTPPTLFSPLIAAPSKRPPPLSLFLSAHPAQLVPWSRVWGERVAA